MPGFPWGTESGLQTDLDSTDLLPGHPSQSPQDAGQLPFGGSGLSAGHWAPAPVVSETIEKTHRPRRLHGGEVFLVLKRGVGDVEAASVGVVVDLLQAIVLLILDILDIRVGGAKELHATPYRRLLPHWPPRVCRST